MKPASPTPSNMGSPTSSHTDTDRRIKVLRGSAVRKRISVPMCDHSTACNPHRNIRHRWSTIKRVHRLHLILYSDIIHNTATDQRYAWSQSNTHLVKKLAPLTTRSSSLRCESAAEHYTMEQYSITGRTKPRKYFPRSDLSWTPSSSRHQAFEKLL